MSRFEMVGNIYVNVDKIRLFWREGEEGEILAVELDNGKVLRTHDERGGWQNTISGYEHIVQIMPCTKPLYMRYRGESGEILESPVYYVGVCADGCVRPLEVCGADEIFFADDISNFVGLYSETLENERRTEWKQ
mgnify:CR=1 FL=1